MVDLVRTAAAQMAGQQTMAPLPKPDAPLLRETTSPFAINWMGAAVDAATMSNAPPRRPGRGRWWAGISPMALTNGIRKPWFCSATIIVSFSSGIRITTG
ncbi:endo-b1,4-mannanase 5C [Klebsiella pneumoniae subsp. rhinoscleromatis]|nr:endo-b1,4-mannanase 5C [Klebsiella pneumoniae subsp. rhinoscleromatis]